MKKIILLSVYIFLTAGIFAQQIIYVNASASGANNGTSWTDAFINFQTGVNTAVSGDAVFVAKGIYQPGSSQAFSMKAGVKIYGGFAGTESDLSQRDLAAGNASILKGNGFSVMRNNAALNTTAVLDGFTITSGSANQGPPGNMGGGIYNGNNSSPLLTNLIIALNGASYAGGGMYNDNGSSPVLFNVVFSQNSAQNGGAMYNFTNCNPRIINTTFWGNSAPSGGGAMYNYSACAPVLINVIMWGNKLGGNDGPSSSIYNAFAGAQPVVSHSLIAHSYGSGPYWAYYVGTDGGGNMDTDPKFIDPASGDFGLKINSLAINAGDNAAIPVGYSNDLAGNGRVYDQATGGLVDIGVYEYQGNPLRPDANGILYVDSAAAIGGDGSSWAKALKSFGFAINGGTILNAASTAPADSLRQIWVAKGTYQPDTLGHSFFMLPKVKIYGGFAGTEGSLTKRNLTAADTSTLKGNGASVIQNMSNGLDSTALLDGFCITGGHPSGMTTTDGSGGGILNWSASPTLSHLMIKDNSAANTGGGIFNNMGADPVLTDIIITGNTAPNGGGIANSMASPVLRNISITANSAQEEGGGMYNGNSSSPVLINVLISDNKTTSGFGGAMTNYLHSSPSLTNVTMTANTASSRGGGMHNEIQSNPILTNCILWGNSAVSGQQIWNSNQTTVTFHYCLYADGPDDIVENAGSSTVRDTHSVTTAPQFDDAPNQNYRLSGGSPAINAGINDSIAADDTTDIAGKSRIFNKAIGGIVDIGAYEYQASLPHPDLSGIFYVDSAAAPGGDGSGWATALPQFADALKAAAQINATAPGTVKQIWITSGTYYPLYAPVTKLDDGNSVSARDRTFMLVQNVAIYGGFNGTENDPRLRSHVTGNGTVLSGDIGVPGDLSDNVYHVVTAIGDGTTPSFTGLGNLTIEGGNANGATSYTLNGNTPLQRQGGGVYLGKANVSFLNCLFAGNRALKKGGAIMNVSGAPSVSNSSYIINSTFADNDAEAGKAIYNYQIPTPILIVNSIVLGSIQSEGAAPVVDFSLVEGLPADPANHDLDGSVDPQFEDAAGGNYRLKANSPAVDEGSNSVVNMTINPVDLDGYARITDMIMGGNVDMGPYEYHSTVLPVKMSALGGVVSNTGHAVLSWKSFSEINNKGFQVQNSIDGSHFENDSFVASKAPGGNSTNSFDYTFDAGLFTGKKYYRLVQTDINGKTAYSNVIVLEAISTGFAIKAYPNPALSFVNIHVDAPATSNGKILVVAVTGNVVKVQNITGADSKIDLSGLSDGIYLLKYTDGKNNATLKIIKE